MTAEVSTRRVAIVTGAARGIGFASARRLAADGVAVTLMDRSPEVVEAAASLRREGLLAVGITGDASSADSVAEVVTRTREELGPVSILVNNAALTAVHRDWKSVTPEQWDEVLRVNLSSMFLFSRAVIADMEGQGWGRIVNISSVTAHTGQRDLIDYVSAKGGVIAFTRTLAREAGASGITVNTVTPGAIRTEHELEVHGDLDPAPILADQAVQRRGTADDIAAAVAFFCSDDAGFISGQELIVDGGWVMG